MEQVLRTFIRGLSAWIRNYGLQAAILGLVLACVFIYLPLLLVIALLLAIAIVRFLFYFISHRQKPSTKTRDDLDANGRKGIAQHSHLKIEGDSEVKPSSEIAPGSITEDEQGAFR